MNNQIQIIGCGYFKMPQVFAELPSNLRTVEKYEVELLTLSNAISYINGTPHRLTSPCIIIAKPGQTRQTKGYFESYYIHIRCEDHTLASDFLKNSPDIIPVSDINQYVYLLNDIIKCHTAEKSISNDLCITGKLYNLFGKISERIAANNIIEKDFIKYESIISDSQRFISQNFEKKLTLSMLSETAHFSPSHFHRIFKKITGTTPNEYILSVRITNAKLLLLTSEKSLADIAFECGFDTQSYMNYVFKKKLGKTPLEFRENQKYSVI